MSRKTKETVMENLEKVKQMPENSIFVTKTVMELAGMWSNGMDQFLKDSQVKPSVRLIGSQRYSPYAKRDVIALLEYRLKTFNAKIDKRIGGRSARIDSVENKILDLENRLLSMEKVVRDLKESVDSLRNRAERALTDTKNTTNSDKMFFSLIKEFPNWDPEKARYTVSGETIIITCDDYSYKTNEVDIKKAYGYLKSRNALAKYMGLRKGQIDSILRDYGINLTTINTMDQKVLT